MEQGELRTVRSQRAPQKYSELSNELTSQASPRGGSPLGPDFPAAPGKHRRAKPQAGWEVISRCDLSQFTVSSGKILDLRDSTNPSRVHVPTSIKHPPSSALLRQSSARTIMSAQQSPSNIVAFPSVSASLCSLPHATSMQNIAIHPSMYALRAAESEAKVFARSPLREPPSPISRTAPKGPFLKGQLICKKHPSSSASASKFPSCVAHPPVPDHSCKNSPWSRRIPHHHR